MTFEKRHLGGGLTNLPRDDNDLSMGAIFGRAFDVPTIDFDVAKPIKIKNQLDSDLCTAYATCAVSEDQEGIELSPEYFFAQEKKMEGSWKSWGANLRTACKVATKVGFIEQGQSPFTLERDGRDMVANWENWNSTFDQLAVKHEKQIYLTIDGPYDLFDNMLATMWAYRDEKRSILTGAMWRDEWTNTKWPGVIPSTSSLGKYGHAFKLCGQKFIGSVPYIKAQLSNGLAIGDQGFFYFPRQIINEEFTFGNFMFKDLPKDVTLDQAKEKSRLFKKGIIGRTTFYIQEYIREIMK